MRFVFGCIGFRQEIATVVLAHKTAMKDLRSKQVQIVGKSSESFREANREVLDSIQALQQSYSDRTSESGGRASSAPWSRSKSAAKKRMPKHDARYTTCNQHAPRTYTFMPGGDDGDDDGGADDDDDDDDED